VKLGCFWRKLLILLESARRCPWSLRTNAHWGSAEVGVECKCAWGGRPGWVCCCFWCCCWSCSVGDSGTTGTRSTGRMAGPVWGSERSWLSCWFSIWWVGLGTSDGDAWSATPAFDASDDDVPGGTDHDGTAAGELDLGVHAERYRVDSNTREHDYGGDIRGVEGACRGVSTGLDELAFLGDRVLLLADESCGCGRGRCEAGTALYRAVVFPPFWPSKSLFQRSILASIWSFQQAILG